MMTCAVALHADRSSIRHGLPIIDKSVYQVVFSDRQLQAEFNTFCLQHLLPTKATQDLPFPKEPAKSYDRT